MIDTDVFLLFLNLNFPAGMSPVLLYPIYLIKKWDLLKQTL